MKPKIVAHRGHSQKYPENTVLAFNKAVSAGADGIELDVHFTKDKQLVVHHFFELGKTNDGEGKIFEKDLSYLQSLDAGSWFDPSFKGEKIPSLEEVFLSLGISTDYEIELKAYNQEFIDRVLKLVRERELLPVVQFTSYQYPLLSYIKKQEPEASVGFIAPRIPDWMDTSVAWQIIKANLILKEIDVLHCPNELYNQSFVTEIKNLGIKVHFGLCDTEEQIRNAIALEADEFTTNNLELAVKIVNE